ncbi:LuxR C-terminal-related transcriptional regulator [Nocardioides sp. LS1]|uniref:ATP-binding protein n=1 Tax=Nocardioides sp. LS1 TaxID=1027620 RepID=UPI000F61D882|nr:LuxR C-terminal-related transcriptional regulator [Nocardioides sp. LS1]GCD88237.1 LuxR family transcriptional regulator [Nocardioides sp. LS1]
MGATAAERRSNLPAELSSFVGRRHELASVRSGLASHRLVTLLGPGGMGKTRLAYRAAADQERRLADGAWVAELAPVPLPELVPDTVVAALGLRSAAGSPTERLVAHLRERHLLLVLDNCEHVQDAARALAAELLDACPALRILATSREALALPGELVLPVPPLPMPGQGVASPEALMHFDAVRLFVDRAAASWSSFQVTADNQEALAELVRRLDGMPLAIELAAVRVRSLTVEQILERLSDRFALLTRGSRAASPRQQTLQALLDWSHDQLEPRERMAWARTSVFSGGFDLAALEAVACDDDLPGEALPDVVDRLVAKSVLVREPSDVGGAARFHMLDSLREYGAARLAEAGGTARHAERHRHWYAERAALAARELFGPSQVDWFDRMRADHDNLRSALERLAHDPADAAEGLRMACAMQHHWVMVGRFGEGRAWVERLLAQLGDQDAASATRAAGLEVAGRLAVLQGQIEVGRPLLKEALATATAAGDATWRAHSLHGLALASAFWGEPAAALPLLEQALELHREGTDPFGVPLALVQVATVHAALDDPDRAMARAEECIALSEAASERWCAAMARWVQALVQWRLGRGTRARTYARDVLRLKEPFGDRMGMAMSLAVVAWAESEAGHAAEAARLLGAVESALDSIGATLFGHLHEDHDRCLARTREALGELAFARAFEEGAALRFDEAVALAVGRRTPAPADPDADGVRLTRRETEIATLVAEGLTNREIAERLVMARRTAEGHVAHILGKLSLTSRSQVAAWVAAQHPAE